MPIQVWISSFAIALAVPVLWWALSGNKDLAARAVQSLGDRRPTSMREAVLERSAAERLLLPLAKGTGRFGRRFTPTHWISKFEKQLGSAGLLGRYTGEQVVGGKILIAGAALVYGLLRVLQAPSPRGFAYVLAATVIGFFVPDLLLRSMADRRRDKIQRALPDMLDQLTISVEAGLGFEAALGRISATNDDPLNVEFSRMLQDIRLGKPRMDALADVATRADVPDLQQVILALRQAEKLGVPLAKTLRIQASELREKRKFRAEEMAYKLPVKMIFPLGFCILPALFIVVLGPAAIRLGDVF